MTDLMQTLFDYIQENRVRNFLPHKYFWHYSRVLTLREDALLDTLSDEQRDLLEQYQNAECDCQTLEKEATFLATLALARELG